MRTSKLSISDPSRVLWRYIQAGVLIWIIVFFYTASTGVEPSPELVKVIISCRVLDESGNGVFHLYEYNLDGTLIKQLTDEPNFDDIDAVFDDSGNKVHFTRKAIDKSLIGESGYSILNLESGVISRPAKNGSLPISVKTADQLYADDSSVGSYESPDGRCKLQMQGKIWYLEKASQVALEVTGLPGFTNDKGGTEWILVANGNPFISDGSFNASFFMHRSPLTDGFQLWGIDINQMRCFGFSGNGGRVYHVPHSQGVFIITGGDVLLLKNGLTCDLTQLEWCDSKMQTTSFGPYRAQIQSVSILVPPATDRVSLPQSYQILRSYLR